MQTICKNSHTELQQPPYPLHLSAQTGLRMDFSSFSGTTCAIILTTDGKIHMFPPISH